jgi:nicotinamide riboside kinase
VAIVGAESTGKTTLAAALAPQLAQQSGLRVAWVPEVLREWCAHVGRTPQAHEQATILRSQQERIDAAAAAHDVVVCDTTPLMTAVYSRLVFGDGSLDERAVHLHRRMALTLLMAIDLPWVPDGHQRDGPQVREPVDTLLRGLLQAHHLPFAVVGGVGEARVAQALAAVAPLLRGPASPRAKGLFTGLGATAGARPHRSWTCECCVAEYERALLRPQP